MRIVPEAGGEHGPEVVGTEIEKDLRDVVRADVRDRAKNEQMLLVSSGLSSAQIGPRIVWRYR